MLLPLPTEKIRALLIENHLALAMVRGRRGHLDQVSCLVRVIYLAFYLRDAVPAGVVLDLYRQAESALNACITRVGQGERCLLLDHELATVARILVVHDEQLRPSRGIATWTPGNDCNTTSWRASARRLRPQRTPDDND
ncbi:hypothetical protein [Burkholderia cepacia]|uniref:hypothetical protein n=1 Tax=Burkholderia cepacia TaxID=292 RepID=UPI002AB64D18|nr:hypothetical protein [Burkholderia cepacia]